MISFSIDKQRDKVNAEWMSRPVDARKPLVLVLISMEQSLTFAYRVKRKLLSGPIFGGAYIPKLDIFQSHLFSVPKIVLRLVYSKNSSVQGLWCTTFGYKPFVFTN
jgi:hypothetical protein